MTELMEFEVAEKIRAEGHERSDQRTTCRNGHCDRVPETQVGRLHPEISKARQGS